MGVEPKIGFFSPKMDGENNGSKPYEQMDDLGGFTPIFGSTPICMPHVTNIYTSITSLLSHLQGVN